MNQLLPFLEICGPEGEKFSVELTEDRFTIGRFQEYNDIGLEPDPQQLVTRRVHCIVEREADTWWVIDNNSVNKTFVRRNQSMEIVYGRMPIADGDTILILGKLPESGGAVYWELTLRDPMKTNRVVGGPRIVYLEYDWIQAKLFRVEGSQRQEITNLRPQEHKLIRYMDQRNRANGNTPVMCTFEELITAIWGDEINHTRTEVNHLVFELRQKIEPDSGEPRFLQTVGGLGYRLETRVLKT